MDILLSITIFSGFMGTPIVVLYIAPPCTKALKSFRQYLRDNPM